MSAVPSEAVPSEPPPRARPRGPAAAALLMGLGYLLLAEAGRLLTVYAGPYVPLWAAAGLAVAVLSTQPRERWPLLLAAGAVANLVSDVALHGQRAPIAVGFAAINMAEAWGCAALLARLGLPFRLDGARALAGFVGAAAAACAAAAAGGAALVAGSLDERWLHALARWWIADLIGVLVVAPTALVLLVPGELQARALRGRAIDAVALVLATVMLGGWVFWWTDGLPVAWVPLPLLLWSALRFGVPGAALATLGLALLAVGGTAAGHGPFGPLAASLRITVAQALLAVFAITTLLVATLYRQQREVRRSLRASLDQTSAMLRAISDHSHDIVFARGVDGRLQFANPAIERFFGRPPSELVGLRVDEIVPDPVAAREIIESDRRILESGRAETVEHEVEFPDGARLVLLSTKAPMRDGEGRVTGLVGIAHDLSERKRAEQAIADRERRMRLALQAARMVAYEWDLGTDEVRRTGRIDAVPGDGVAERGTGAAVLESLPPADRERLREAVAGLAPERDTFTLTYEIRRPDGSRAVVEETAQARFDAQGRVASLAGVSMDVTDRALAVEALRAANARKDEFLAMLAHELRNPLAPIRNGVRYLRGTAGGVGPVDATLAMLERQVAHLVRLVDDLLDVSRITQGRVALRRERVALSAVVATAIEAARPLIDEMGHRLLVEQPAESPMLDADPTRLAQVLGNLLNNAAKYSPPGRRIWLLVDQCGANGSDPSDGGDRGARGGGAPAATMARVRVRDEGMGIAPELLPEVFELFTQGERSLDRSHGGMGIGLALVKRLVEMHGGRVSADSAGAGQGAEVTVLLPLAPPGPAGSDAAARGGRDRERVAGA